MGEKENNEREPLPRRQLGEGPVRQLSLNCDLKGGSTRVSRLKNWEKNLSRDPASARTAGRGLGVLLLSLFDGRQVDSHQTDKWDWGGLKPGPETPFKFPTWVAGI